MKFLILIISLIFIKSEALSLKKQAESGEIKVTKQVAFEIYRDNYFKLGKETDEKFLNFFENLKKISEINSARNSTWVAGINQNTFMSNEEYNARLPQLGQNCSATARQFQNQNGEYSLPEYKENADLPTYFDWRDYGVVTGVKDQQNCGSCWAFSTTGCLESHWAIKTGVSPPLLSEQQLLDCAGDFDNNGCEGGLPSHAFEYIKYAEGLSTEVQYPYVATELFGCEFKGIATGAKVKGGSFNITFADENELQQQLYESGPVSIAYTVFDDFGSYKGGIYNNPECPSKPEDVNHAVLAVGWGEDAGVKYWILKNSWGPNWGENGYFRMVRGVNMCGMADCASYPILDVEKTE